jgi:hypothetical protein
MVSLDSTYLPNPSPPGKTIRAELKCPGKAKKRDAVGRSSSRSSLLRHPDALFSAKLATSIENQKRARMRSTHHYRPESESNVRF